MQQCLAAVFPAAVTCAIISTLGIAAVILMASRRRTAIRERYGIEGTPMGDCCLWTWCAPCALAQVGVEGGRGCWAHVGYVLLGVTRPSRQQGFTSQEVLHHLLHSGCGLFPDAQGTVS
jgi:hypothetical protein